MTPSAQVQSIQALDDLKGALGRFAGESQEALQAAEQEIRRTLDWLQERLNHWQNEVRRRQEEVRKAAAAQARCQASGYYDRDGHYYAPDCSAYERALRQAQIRLQEAESELRNVQQWMKVVGEAVAAYRTQAQRLGQLLATDLPKAEAFLGRASATLQSYVTMTVPPSGVSAPTEPTLSTTPPMQAVADMFTTSVGLSVLGAEFTGAAIALIHWIASDVRQALGPVGEQLSARLLSEQFGLQEVPFDQRKHGFDRLFTAPGLPLIVLESKVNRNGQFHLGQTQVGEQGSPAWIDAHTERMADRGSAEWSPTNERIAAIIRELGPENVPVVTVVIQTDTGLADVYYRAPGVENWQQLRGNVSLKEVLR